MPNRDEIKLSGKQARQGEIILRSKWRRFVFIAGLVAAIIVAIVLSYAI